MQALIKGANKSKIVRLYSFLHMLVCSTSTVSVSHHAVSIGIKTDDKIREKKDDIYHPVFIWSVFFKNISHNPVSIDPDTNA